MEFACLARARPVRSASRLELDTVRLMDMDRRTIMARLRSAPMATTIIILTLARRTASTALTGLSAASLSAPVRGFVTGFTDAADSTGGDFTVVVPTDADSMADEDLRAAGSAGAASRLTADRLLVDS